jgi:hypothetical protein
MILRLTDGTTTLNLEDGSDGLYLAEGYVPLTPNVSTIEAVSEALVDGGEVTQVTRRNVTESVVLTVTGADAAAIQSTLHSLAALLIGAEEYQRSRGGARCWVEYAPNDSAENVYRSEILRGSVQPAERTAAAMYLAEAIEVTVAWRRRFFWEGARTALPLTNGNGTDVTAGLTVYNHDDGGTGHDNYVAIDGADVAGVLPTPLELAIENTYNVSARTYNAMVGLNAFSNPGSLSHILEAEDADYVVGGAAAVADGDNSGGYYQPVSWSPSIATNALRWALSTARLNACAGRWFRLWARFHSQPGSGLYLTPKITYPSGSPLTVVSEGQEVLLSSTGYLQDLGTLQLPPWLPGETGFAAVDLSLYAREDGGGSFNLDYVQLTPLDGYRVLVPRGYGAAYGATLVDDGIDGSLYLTFGSTKAGFYIGQGRPIHVWPGRDQRLYVLFTSTSGAEIARTHQVQAWYRPRRLTL